MSYSYIDDVLGEGGVLARAIPGFAAREGQLEFARAVDSAFSEDASLLAEAPCGTGKGAGYCVPAVYHATQKGRRVVIATANIALQEQLVGHDLPSLRAALPWPFQYALAKGRSNFLCLDRYNDVRAELVLAGGGAERGEFAKVEAWADVTTTGDFSELPFEVQPDLRRRLTVAADECTGKACESYAECFANRANAKLADAHVVVTNYHLLLLHLQIAKATNGEAGILPPFDLLAMDECHALPSIAKDVMGFRITPGGIRWVGRLLGGVRGKKSVEPIDAELKARLGREADRFERELRAIRRSPDYAVRLRDAVPRAVWGSVVDTLRDAGAAYLRASATRVLATGRKMEILKLGVRAGDVARHIEEAMTVANPNVGVYFIEEDARGKVALVSKPVDVSEALRGMVWESPSIRSVVGTSATLRTSSGFWFIKRETGAEKARELAVESPFDHEEQALLIFPAGMPEPKGKEYAEAVAGVVSEAVRLAGGRGVLGLFTSYASLAVAHERVEREHGGRVRVLRQGEAPRTALVKAFRADISSVLLGTESFWSGVDVPGEALSVVVIDKLPFAPPDDPILDAIQEADPRGWFTNYAIPRAVIAFRQGAGRLLRSVSDRGVIVCCDPRVLGKGYGRAFLRALPEMRVSRKLEDVAGFLGAPKVPGNLPRGGGASGGTGAQGGPVPGQRGAVSRFALGPSPSNVVDEGLRAIVGGARRRKP